MSMPDKVTFTSMDEFDLYNRRLSEALLYYLSYRKKISLTESEKEALINDFVENLTMEWQTED